MASAYHPSHTADADHFFDAVFAEKYFPGLSSYNHFLILAATEAKCPPQACEG
jgi:hypothetical protein